MATATALRVETKCPCCQGAGYEIVIVTKMFSGPREEHQECERCEGFGRIVVECCAATPDRPDAGDSEDPEGYILVTGGERNFWMPVQTLAEFQIDEVPDSWAVAAYAEAIGVTGKSFVFDTDDIRDFNGEEI